jgi:peptide-methionine (R)-S-oxide reductase
MKTKILMPLMLAASFLTSCVGQNKKITVEKPAQEIVGKIVKTDAEWKKQLTSEQYEVLRNKGTERAFTGEYTDNFQKGKYVCAACNNLLFLSDAKFHSDCGWPSFDKAIKGSVVYTEDTAYGMTRTEVTCAKCDGHLGHVFNDGPTETSERFCTNSVSVKFIPEK